MDFATLNYAAISEDLQPLGNIPKNSKRYSLGDLRRLESKDLPLLIDIAPRTERPIYSFTLTSVTSTKTWTISYRYSEFETFRTNLEDNWICHDSNCSGSCQALREIVSFLFPKKRLPFLSSTQGAFASRQKKFKIVLIHLLRSVLLPGSVMKCCHARQNLPSNLFQFLGVDNPDDRRSVLQIFVDNMQAGAISNAKELASANCTVCLENVQFETEDSDTDHSDEEDNKVELFKNTKDDSRIVLPCQHSFHRNCIFEWVLSESKCPVCRASIVPNATASYCRSTHNHSQWWMSDLERDLKLGLKATEKQRRFGRTACSLWVYYTLKIWSGLYKALRDIIL
ncbi:hypothetical protein DVH05_004636 [Phytophthora capsici]|nr:hypothetical protein DVH05_004636 [Phytophthora capsici]